MSSIFTFGGSGPGEGHIKVKWNGVETFLRAEDVSMEGLERMLEIAVSEAKGIAHGDWVKTIQKTRSRARNRSGNFRGLPKGKFALLFGSDDPQAIFKEHGRPGNTPLARGSHEGQHALYGGYDKAVKKLMPLLKDKV